MPHPCSARGKVVDRTARSEKTDVTSWKEQWVNRVEVRGNDHRCTREIDASAVLQLCGQLEDRPYDVRD